MKLDEILKLDTSTVVRQGDVVFTPIGALPDGVVKLDTHVVKSGAHSHRLTAGTVYQIGGADGQMYVDVPPDAVSGHEEHHDSHLVGVYAVSSLAQLNGEAWGPVLD
jgi:hypothetical protein